MTFKKCEGSGYEQMLTWLPVENENYPGATVCLFCSYGVMVTPTSVRESRSEAGTLGLSGKMKTHYVNFDDNEGFTYKKPKEMK